MSGERLVAVTAEQAEILDEVIIPALMRANQDRHASHMMALALAWKFAKPLEPPLPDNVVDFEDWSKRVAQ